jgi:serine/threonine-protein kinase
MPAPPITGDAVLELVRKSELADDDVLRVFLQKSGPIPPTAADTATRLVQSGILTQFQARQILLGKHKGFRLGPYKILDQLGAGGMGQVFLAEHLHLHRRVALKVLPPRLAGDKRGVDRFYREARAAAALDHPNIVRAYDISCDKGTHFLVLEYVPGVTLESLLNEAGGRLPVGTACDYVVQAAAGLQHAHEKGVSHGDIKPANLIVSPQGVVKILDMGLASFFQSACPTLKDKNEPNVILGTADYLAPEQATGCARADHRVDIYSLGATLYHLVTGQPPFSGSTTAKLLAHQLNDVPTAHEVRDEVPEEVSGIIARMMAKDPAQRYQSAHESAVALLPYTGDTPHLKSTPSGKLAPIVAPIREEPLILSKTPQAEKWLMAGLVLAIVVVLAAIVVMLL